VCIVLTIALFTIVVVAIVARYGFGQAVSWTEEVPRYLLIWISFLAAASCVLRREHVGFDVLFNALPKPVRRALGVFLSALIFMFGWIVFRYGIVFVRDFGPDMMETIPFTNYWYYIVLPISGALLLLFSLKNILDAFLGRHESQIGRSVD
jgi:TRAP-type C4-dicarboxylate transport system permease small subunit